jgi:MoaA/NifB/PqqE/SkfB family radical SAM enzyme
MANTVKSEKPTVWAQVNEQGDLVIPKDVVTHYGLTPGALVRLDEDANFVRLHRPITHLAKVYIEPTSRCNLSCRTCIRNAWEEPQGDMTSRTFDQLVENLKALPSRPDIFFGGFGEPLLLSNIAEMVERVKAVAGKVELITNGMLLTEERSRELIEAGLDTLWVSVDGATAEHYADVRLGAALPTVFDNIIRFSSLRESRYSTPEIGISFVAMRKNIADLPVLIQMSDRLGASRYLVTNVLPYTKEMCQEMLYTHSLDGVDTMPSPQSPHIDLPRIDLNPENQNAIVEAIRYRQNVQFNGVPLGQDKGRCPFIESGSVAVSWDGVVSPCLALMHHYISYLHGQRRSVERHAIGNLMDQDLKSIWDTPDYVDFRKRVQAFDFSPCIWCGGCSWSEKNQEDCFSNTFPTCGGCLWAQGVIQCP